MSNRNKPYNEKVRIISSFLERKSGRELNPKQIRRYAIQLIPYLSIPAHYWDLTFDDDRLVKVRICLR